MSNFSSGSIIFPPSTSSETAADYARVGVLAWYYGIANAASAMTAAQSGSFQEDHAGTARLWDEQIASRGLAMAPFSWRVSSLVEKTCKVEVSTYRQGSPGKLVSKPANPIEALGAAAEYLSGSANWYAWRTREDLMKTPQFKSLGVTDFRKKAARGLRDERLKKKSIGFVHQAARYRGKANYREAFFSRLQLKYRDDPFRVRGRHALGAQGVSRDGRRFARRELGRDLWSEFVADVDAKKAFTTRAGDIWT
ncbi:hypothetical protein [Pseudooceanicola sp.]|uniref:hypothetical protein n=1 Tax=Pseudooceanicola sp. TaxID=1914328 RepID=UPI0035117216